MDARITKSRLSNLFSYDWLRIIITIVVAVFIGIVVLLSIGTKPTTAQQMYLLYYKDLYLSDDYSVNLEENSDKMFSYEILSSSYFEMSSDSTYGETAFSARFAAGQRNILFSSDKISEDDEKPYVEAVVSSFSGITENIDEYLSAAAEYANSFYGGDYLNGELDEEYLSSQFRARAANDKRYKTEKKMLSGIEDEKDRISLLRSSLIAVNTAIENGVIEKYYMTLEEGGESLPYALKIGTKKMSSLAELVYSYDEESGVKTSDGICAVFFKPLDSSCDYMRFEGLNYISYLITTYAGD